MIKKLFLALILTFAFVIAFSVSVFAVDTNNNAVDYNAKVTLSDGRECALFDSDGTALIWYLDSSGLLNSIRTDDTRINYTKNDSGNTFKGIEIVLESETVLRTAVVVFNGIGVESLENVTIVSGVFSTNSNLQYVYLHHNTKVIQGTCFKESRNLKFINLEDLTNLTQINNGDNFNNCTSLFSGQVLDLSKTKLQKIHGGGNFSNVPFAGIKFPSTLTEIGGWNFKGTGLTSIAFPETVTSMSGQMFGYCKSLETVYLHNSLTSIGSDSFDQCDSLKTIFYVGTKAQLLSLLNATPIGDLETQWGPDRLWQLIGVTENDERDTFKASLISGEIDGNLISYADYKKLEDKSGKYVVYDYSHCEAYKGGVHSFESTNNCVKTCSVCGETAVNHNEENNIDVEISYISYDKSGTKTLTCKNEGCGNVSTVSAEALFKYSGFSTPEDGRGEIAIGYVVNAKAMSEYESTQGKTLTYGVFAGLKDKIGSNDIFSGGKATDGVITAEVSKDYYSFVFKITGFDTDEQKTVKLAYGVYVIDNTGKLSYVQLGTPNENEKYVFVSYNDVSNSESNQ